MTGIFFKSGSALMRRVASQPSAMHFDDPLRNSKAKPGAAFGFGMRALGLLEFLKNLGLIGLGNARPGIGHRNRVTAVRSRGLHGDFAGIGELDRVADKIEEHLR